MTYIEAIFLHCLAKINGERTIFSVYHLLKGKRSSQTIQDAHLYSLTSMFYSYPAIDRNRFEKMAAELAGKQLIYMIEPEKYILTQEGKRYLNSFFEVKPFPSALNGWLYGSTVEVFWKRLSLLIQVLSHFISGEQRYYPVQRDSDIQNWIKSFLYNPPVPLGQLNKDLYSELILLGNQNRFPDDPSILVSRFTGREQVGLTRVQAAEAFNLPEDEYWYRFLNVLTYVVADVNTRESEFPVLYSIMDDLVPEISLTQSSEETYRLLRRGFGIKRIAQFRKLKESTIEDHVVEIALNDNTFSIEAFISQEEIQRVLQKAREVKKRKLKPIKDALPQLSYFQIRLTLAKHGDTL
ncbi:helix-turn-helix domain-containing protein [Bacillus sp. AK031]